MSTANDLLYERPTDPADRLAYRKALRDAALAKMRSNRPWLAGFWGHICAAIRSLWGR